MEEEETADTQGDNDDEDDVDDLRDVVVVERGRAAGTRTFLEKASSLFFFKVSSTSSSSGRDEDVFRCEGEEDTREQKRKASRVTRFNGDRLRVRNGREVSVR